jgi:class 3 adenylate cyclase
MAPLSARTVDPPIEATALIVDLRNFTPNLNASRIADDGVNTFCDFLSEFYADCLGAAQLALPPRLRHAPPYYVSSTGDGALFVFRGERHHDVAFLAAILMDARLARRCAAYGHDPRFAGAPGTSYGIGVESGAVSRVQSRAADAPPSLDTYIGHCVNVAARTESITKLLDQANTMFADTVVERVAASVFARTFDELRRREAACTGDAERAAIHDEMSRLNHELCIAFTGRHVLKGVGAPMPVYRLARTAVVPGVERFERLLRGLVHDDLAHLAEVCEALR